MQFTTVTAILAGAATVAAAPAALEARTNWGTPACPDRGQYHCVSSAGLVNALNCVNAVNGNQISIPIHVDLKKRTDNYPGAPGSSPYCCKSVGGLINLLNCVNLLNNNVIEVPISLILGIF